MNSKELDLGLCQVTEILFCYYFLFLSTFFLWIKKKKKIPTLNLKWAFFHINLIWRRYFFFLLNSWAFTKSQKKFRNIFCIFQQLYVVDLYIFKIFFFSKLKIHLIFNLSSQGCSAFFFHSILSLASER